MNSSEGRGSKALLDIKLLREEPAAIKQNLEKRNLAEKLPLVDEAAELDRTWRKQKTEVEELRHKQNQLTVEVATLKKAGKPIEGKLKEIKDLPERIKRIESEAVEKYAKLQYIMMSLPNILHDSVPKGTDEKDNIVVATWGKIPKFGFTPKHHIDILEALGMVDVERAAKVAGARMFFLKGDMVKLEHSIMRYAIDSVSAKGFTPVEPPFLMNRKSYEGVTDIASFGPVIYKIEGEDLYLIATSEHPLVAMHSDEIIEGSALPIKYCGFSPCFRVEAGAHGKDTKGIFRTHQFYKVEQVVFSRPEDSWSLHEELIANAREIFQNLGLPHRVVTLCSGDTGMVSAKTYDLEAWLPAQEKFREMVSASNVTDFQARRLLIRYRDKTNDPTRLLHTLNSTAVTTRALVAIIENYQQEDGSVAVPDVLVPYMGGLERITSR
ncbi:MAG: serine--tRNA ligase [Thaumarchaeota archaeon]|nr:serine--tRNA ligase [Nitrososphaerota archaeon]